MYAHLSSENGCVVNAIIEVYPSPVILCARPIAPEIRIPLRQEITIHCFCKSVAARPADPLALDATADPASSMHTQRHANIERLSISVETSKKNYISCVLEFVRCVISLREVTVTTPPSRRDFDVVCGYVHI